jgi:predicted TIM-barrel fold metal-dependent hydrolase
VFSGIGEFTIHKEFVLQIAGEIATHQPGARRILDFAAEVGLVVILHNDINMPFPKPDQEPYMLKQMKELFARHPRTTIIWAHCGLGRIVRPIQDQLVMLERALANPQLKHVYIDISWDEVAKYIVQSPESSKLTADLINRYPGRSFSARMKWRPQISRSISISTTRMSPCSPS